MTPAKTKALILVASAICGALAVFFPKWQTPLAGLATALTAWTIRAPGDAKSLPSPPTEPQ